MIDLLIAAWLPLPFLLWWFRRNPRGSLLAFLAIGALFHAGSLLQIFTAPVPDVVFPVRGTPADLAGASGSVLTVNGTRPESLGRLLTAFAPGAMVETRGGIVPASGWKIHPWDSVSSYDVEEASGGLSLLPRHPLVPGGLLELPSVNNEVRVVSAAGIATATVADLIRALRGMPREGMAPLRVMRPSPDDGMSTAAFSPLLYAPGLSLVRGLGIDLTRVIMPTLPLPPSAILFVNDERVVGTGQLLQLYQDGLAKGGMRIVTPEGIFGITEERLFLRPRVALLPWMESNAFSSWILGFTLSPLRQALGVVHLRNLARVWDSVPRQYYKLDDAAFLVPGFVFFRLASVFVSAFLAAALAGRGRRRWLFCVVYLLLQSGDLLVVLGAG